ncbi:MAG: zinc ABC transporter substrate-binding protein [Pseudomonadota bacterium]|nr:zinc ABC transporter substrate-binding protein [Pseudomonadota bacterium]
MNASLIGILRAALLGLLFNLTPARADAPRVTVSLKPLHSLTAGVMEGVGEPELLLQGSASPHSFVLRPSDARKLYRADLVIWAGPGMETFLVRPLAARGSANSVVTLMEEPKIELLPLGAEHKEAASGHQAPHEFDPHIWLSPANASATIDILVRELGTLDPGNRGRYEQNGAALKQRVAVLDERLSARLSPVKEVKFLVYHDAFRYFTSHYGLSMAGTVTDGAAHEPGVKRMLKTKDQVRSAGVRCLFSEPQMKASTMETIAEGGGVKTGVLDPLGANLAAGLDAWFQIMENIADSLIGCLKG